MGGRHRRTAVETRHDTRFQGFFLWWEFNPESESVQAIKFDCIGVLAAAVNDLHTLDNEVNSRQPNALPSEGCFIPAISLGFRAAALGRLTC